MDRSEPIKLIKVTYQKDEYGVNRKVETVREVFAQVDSASQSEFYQARFFDKTRATFAK